MTDGEGVGLTALEAKSQFQSDYDEYRNNYAKKYKVSKKAVDKAWDEAWKGLRKHKLFSYDPGEKW